MHGTKLYAGSKGVEWTPKPRSKNMSTKLETTTVALADVAAKHGVFPSDAEYLEMEKRDFVHSILRHVNEDPTSAWDYLELTYRNSNVRFIVKTRKDENGEQFVKEIAAYDHPQENPKMDYDALNNDLQAVLAAA